MSESKLYRVEARIVYYAYANNENEAEGFLRDAINDSDPEARAWLIEEPKTLVPTDGWDRDCLVYHDGLDDVSLGQVMDGTVPGEDDDESADDE